MADNTAEAAAQALVKQIKVIVHKEHVSSTLRTLLGAGMTPHEFADIIKNALEDITKELAAEVPEDPSIADTSAANPDTDNDNSKSMSDKIAELENKVQMLEQNMQGHKVNNVTDPELNCPESSARSILQKRKAGALSNSSNATKTKKLIMGKPAAQDPRFSRRLKIEHEASPSEGESMSFNTIDTNMESEEDY